MNRLNRRLLLKGSLTLGAGGAATRALGSRSVTAQAEEITLNILIPEHWQVVEGIENNDPSVVPPRRKWFYERVKQWESERPNVKLKFQTAAWEQLAFNFIASSQAGNPPDIVTFDATYLNSVAKGGYLAPLDGFDYDEWDDFNPYVQNDILSVDGKKYGMSNYLASWGLISNTKLLEAAGFSEPPVTWDDVIAQGKALTVDTDGNGSIDRWGFGALMMGELNPTPPGTFATMVWSQGGEVIDENNRALINTTEMQVAVQQIVDLINTHQVMSSDTITMKANEEIDRISTENWATGVAITSYYPPIVENLGKENVRYSPFPIFAGGQSFGQVEVFGWQMSAKTGADSTRADASFAWMAFMAANETLILAAKHQFGQPSRQSVLSDPIFSEDPALAFMANYTVNHGRPVPHMVEKEYWLTTVMEAVHSAILEQQTVGAALENAQAQYDARVRRSR